MSFSSRTKSNTRACPTQWMDECLIYIHKEEALDDVERRFPAEHYVVVDDKLRILAAVKQFWGSA